MDRKEPTLSSSGTFNEPDETLNQRPMAEPVRPKAPRSPAPRAAEPPVSGGSPLALIALVFALAGIAGSGFLGFKLLAAQKHILTADTRIAELEGRLSVTSDESSQSLTQVDAKLKWVDSEIRKLWGIANDTNRKAIDANAQKIAALEKSLPAVQKTANDAKTVAGNLQPQITAGKAAIDDAVVKLTAATSSITEQRKLLQDLTEQLDRTEGQLANLRSLEAKTKTNEEAIAAIDAYRRTLNRDLLQIKQQLGLSAN